jgi:hypothetical protein
MLLYLIQEGSLEIPFIIIGVGSDSIDFQNPCSIVCDHHQPEFVSSDVEHHPVVGKKIG